MIQVENQEINQMPKCKTHKGLPLLFLNTELSSEKKQVALCARCMGSSFTKGKDLLYLGDISELNDSDVLNNWPVLEDQNILQTLKGILEQKEDQEDYLLILEQFIDDMQSKINQKLIKMKKAVINQFSESFIQKQKLINKYNEISCKQELKNSLQLMVEDNQKGLEQIENIIKTSYETKSENQQILKDHIQKYQANQQFLQLKFPKIVEKQLFQKLKLIKKHLLSQVLNQSKDSLDLFKDYLSQSTSTFYQDIDQLKEVQFSQLSNQQIEFLLQTAQFHLQRNEQLSKLDKNNLINQNLGIVSEIERINKELKNLVSQFEAKEQQQFEKILAKQKIEVDASQKYSFLKSLKDQYSQITQNKDGILKIKQKNTQSPAQFFTKIAIDESKKYTIQIDIKPFKGLENNYLIAIGFLKKHKCHDVWLDDDSQSISKLYVSNDEKNKFTLNKKGMLFNNNLINRSELMRKLEIQFCLKERFFQIADYPDYNNITQAKVEEMVRYIDGQEYLFTMKHFSVKSIKVLRFTEGIMDKN
ncbi:ubiquitin family protein, putative (macronuclear) [Tetrahymena thermophila SB210]|uniref:Ubiquitin family protein, putative n=1 Tax=Tetrahymena thermophila (strain SB210) TaxID=312017 RepID=Q22E10_TETTS|nr:ubiquitin family protein, putative [Tetrahymena thermophila SB210]EAR83502.1 ubiquitin family protein, putative [Tetrahymena thermophila SB210]|eukprot:XP_001031165.1 ubiquitin family protein, putative [Tetrahymena thermophila SB210]